MITVVVLSTLAFAVWSRLRVDENILCIRRKVKQLEKLQTPGGK